MSPRPSFSARLKALCVLLFAVGCPLLQAAASPQPASPTAPATFAAESLGKGAVTLDGPWQFHIGDNAAWAQPGIDDATGHDGWEALTADAPWGAQTHPLTTGYGWYRRHLHITTAPGASPDVAMLVPNIDDAYEFYWNGSRLGGLGTFPPHVDLAFPGPPATFGLGPIRDGVLAVRVFKIPFSSVDDGSGGGFEAPPQLGSPEAIAALKTASDYRWLHGQPFRFGLTWLYVLTSFLSLVAWLRDRSQKLLFWLAAFTLMPLLELLLSGLRLPVSAIWLTFLIQTAIQLREVIQWYLLVYLLQLEGSPKLLRFLRIFACINLTAAAVDGGLGFLFGSMSANTFSLLDAILTAFILPAEIVPALLVVIALVQRKQLDAARWLVAFFAFASATWYSVSNFAYQGNRYTHITLSRKMDLPLFTIVGNPFPMQAILRTLLFASIVYAVLRYAGEYRKRQATLEQEFQNARELQKILVPETLPVIPGFRLTSAYKPAQEVGGDFFQIIPLEGADEGSTMIVLGDVSGKGLKAAMTVSLIVGAIRTLAETSSSPARMLAGLNRRLHGRLEGGFATCLALRLDPDGLCTLAGAGHPSPFLNKQELELPGALPLGINPTTVYQEFPYPLKAGDHLALYTDGLLEARNAAGELYGFDRLTILFGNHANAEEASAEAVAFGQDDDITVLTLTCVEPAARTFGAATQPAHA